MVLAIVVALTALLTLPAVGSAITIESVVTKDSTTTFSVSGLNDQRSYSYTDGNCEPNDGPLVGEGVYGFSGQDPYYDGDCAAPRALRDFYCPGGAYYPSRPPYRTWDSCDGSKPITYFHQRFTIADQTTLYGDLYDSNGYYIGPGSGTRAGATGTLDFPAVPPGNYQLFVIDSCNQTDEASQGTITKTNTPYRGAPNASTQPVTWPLRSAYCNPGMHNVEVPNPDTTPPVITTPGSRQAEATSSHGADVSFAVSANDETDGPVGVDCTPASGSTFPLGTTEVACSAADAAGNHATENFDVTVVDTTAPELTLPADISASATSAQGAVASYTASANDAVSGAVTPTCSAASGSRFGLGTTTVNCTATDQAGNKSAGSFKVSVTYGFGGFGSPIKNNTMSGNLGRTIPVKFTLSGTSAGITNATGTVAIAKSGGTFAPATSTDGANGVRYADGQYMFNLSTKGLTAGTYTVRVSLGDGVGHEITLTLS